MDENRFRATIRARMESCGVKTLRELNNHTTTNYKTFLQQWNNPSLFRAQTLSEICSYLSMPADERGKLL